MNLLIALAFVVSAQTEPATLRQGEKAPDRIALDCGPMALHVLLNLTNHSTSLSQVIDALPSSPDGKQTMASLRDAAARFGLSLDGYELRDGKLPGDRPMIAFTVTSEGGHFVVVRSVGRTSTMVQVIEPPYPPKVLDIAALVELPGWTGRVLAPATPWTESVIPPLLLGAAMLLGLGLLGRRAGRRRQALAS